jgi:hypothetical protein
MNINKEHLDAIYEVLVDKLHQDDIVSAYLEKFSVATHFQYRGEKKSFSTIYYLVPNIDRYVKLIELSDVSCDSEVLDRVIEDAQYLITKAREDRQVLDFYMAKIKSL